MIRPSSTAPPLPPRRQCSTPLYEGQTSIVDPHVHQQLIDEGFDKDVVKRALHLANDNVPLARNILMEFCLSSRSDSSSFCVGIARVNSSQESKIGKHENPNKIEKRELNDIGGQTRLMLL